MSAEAARGHLDRFAARTRHLDRLRALELLHLASAVLVLGFRSETSRTALDALFPSVNGQETTAGAASQGAADDAGTPTALPGAAAADTESFCNHAEFVLTTADETTIAASLDSRTGLVRKHIGHALTAYIGTPLLLRALLEGRLRFNRWESFIRRFSWLPLASLRAVDVFITTLDPRISLHQFMRRVSQFIATLTEEPVLAARASQGRRAWVEDLPGGQSILCAKGPTPLVHAHFNEGQALARALVKNQTENLDITHAQKEPREDESASGDEAGTLEQSDKGSADASSAGSTTPASAIGGADSTTASAEGTAIASDDDTADASADLPPLKSLSLDEQRMIQQLTFDTLITARPRTETVLEHATPDSDETDRYRVQVSLPDQATVLRKHATVVVTVPATTLLGLDNRPGMIADSPIPADMARTIAAGSTVWYRILTDPSTGRVLDHVAHKYEPDRATRISVMSKWQTCTAPGCSRPARHCDIDHGIPFNHEHPEQGGRTEPLNLHPLCRRHHQAKTDGLLRMRRITGDEIEWILPLGATSTTSAPALDDGGILTQMSTGVTATQTPASEAPAQAEAPTDPDVLTPDEAMARVWAEILAEQKRWDDRVEQVRESQRNAREEERQRFQAWKDAQKAILDRERESISRKRLDLQKARDQHKREWKLLAVHRAAIHKHNQACGAVLPPHIPLSYDGPVSSTITWKTTIVPMHVDAFAPNGLSAYSLHVPLEPLPFIIKFPKPRSAEQLARDQAWWDERMRACRAAADAANQSSATSGQDATSEAVQDGKHTDSASAGQPNSGSEAAAVPPLTSAQRVANSEIGARLVSGKAQARIRQQDFTDDPPPF